jgi:hypothetical protein
MEITFKFEMELSVNIDDTLLGEVEKTYEGMVNIKTFIQEFIKHPAAVQAYYRSLFLDEFIDNSADQLDVLANFLNYMPDYGPLFVEIAKNCPANVAEFIEYLFSPDTDDKVANTKKELERRILEDELRQLKVTHARFSLQ